MELFLLMKLVPLIGGILALYLGVRFVRAFERRSLDRGEVQALREQVARLDEELTRTTAEVERLTEEQRFALELLSERHGALPPGPMR